MYLNLKKKNQDRYREKNSGVYIVNFALNRQELESAIVE